MRRSAAEDTPDSHQSLAKTVQFFQVSAIKVKELILLVEVTKPMPAMSSEAFCDALCSIMCSIKQQQLGTVNVAALVLYLQGAIMHCLRAFINKDLNIQ